EERWDRQEAKNRALQDAIRQKLRNETPKNEPFRAEPAPEPRAGDGRRGLFGRRGASDFAAGQAAESGDDWSSEPWNAAPAPPPDSPGEWREAPAGEAPMSRWDEMFSA